MAHPFGSHNENPFAQISAEKASASLEQVVDDYFGGLTYLSSLNKESLLEETILGKIPPPRLQIVAPPGLGKTTAVRKQLTRCKGRIIWFMVPNHRLAEELYQDFQNTPEIDVFLIKGRNDENCERNSLAKAVGAKGLSVEKTLCEKGDKHCPYWEHCLYQAQRREIKNLSTLNSSDPPRIFIMTHNYLITHCMAPRPDLVIIDESHWKLFCYDFELNIEKLIDYSDSNLPYYRQYREVIRFVKTAFTSGGLYKNYKKDKNLKLDLAIKHIQAVQRKYSKSDIEPSSPDKRIKQAAHNWPGKELQHVEILLKQIKHELSLKRNTPESISLSGETITVYSLRPNLIPQDIHVLIIDASADLEINRYIWGHSLIERVIEAPRNASIIQIEKSFSKYSLGISSQADFLPDEEKLRLRKEVITLINQLAARNETPIFLAAPKKVLESIEADLHKNILIANYNNLRGQDKFKDCKIGIILSREEPPRENIERLAKCLISRSEKRIFTGEYIKRKKEYLLQNKNTIPSKEIRTHLDPLCTKILNQIREEELLQAMDRLRLIHTDTSKTIYILCNIPLRLCINRLWTWGELLSGGPKLEQALKAAFQKGMAFPLGYSEWHRIFPNIWNTKDTAKKYQDYRGGIKWVEIQLRYLLGSDPFIKIRYRRNKAQRRWSEAIIWMDEENPRIALESVVGGVYTFEIIGSFDPPWKDVPLRLP
jgi:hypothetical protein